MKRIAALMASVCLGLAAPAQAQTRKADFPTKPVVIVVPYSPGGGTDGVSRATARRLTELWGQPVIVENVPGADGLIGTRKVMKSAPDGHTLLISNPTVIFFKHTHKDVGAGDPMQELTPVNLLASGPSALVVQGKSPIHSVVDLKKACIDPAAKCSWASGEQFTLLAGTGLVSELGLADSMANVRYNGTSAAVNDVLGGHVSLLVTGIASVLAPHQAGTARILAVSSAKRLPGLPDVPTYAEVGLGKVEFTNLWYGIFAPKGTPEAVKTAISDALKLAVQDEAVQKAVNTLKIETQAIGPAEFTEFIKRDDATVVKLLAKLPRQ